MNGKSNNLPVDKADYDLKKANGLLEFLFYKDVSDFVKSKKSLTL